MADFLPIGHVLRFGAKDYRITAIEPYRRNDGVETMLYRLNGECRHPDCSEPVTFAISAFNIIKAPTGNTCPAHKGWFDRDAHRASVKAGVEKWRSGMSQSELMQHRATNTARLAAAMANQTPEQRAHHVERLQSGYAKWWASLTPDQRTAIQKKRAAGRKRRKEE